MTQMLQCGTCAMNFTYSKRHKKYCSKSCLRLGQIENQRIWYRNRHPRPPKQCRICGASISEKSKQLTICSESCRERSERRRSKERQIRDKDKFRAQGRQWWLNNKEKHRESNRISAKKRRSRPGVMRREVARYRAKKQKAEVFLFCPRDENRMLERQRHRCAYCQIKLSSENRQLDHVLPLSKGGRHGPSNLVFACSHCNASKNDLFVSEWKRRRKFILNSSPIA